MKIFPAVSLALWMLFASFHPVAGNETKYVCFQIISEPSGAEVFKSHPSEQLTTFIGYTPVNLQCFSTEHLPNGSNTIIVRKRGFQEWKLEIDLTGYYAATIAEAEKKPVLIQAVLKSL